jgi:glyoxylase-like metal-dependent hydrolase (beta-lactamase superfamily II)
MGPRVILEQVVAPYFATNCWIFAGSRNSECFIVDPGIANPNMVAAITRVLKENNLKPVATVVTHGHLDHTFSVVSLDDAYGIPTYVHSTDRRLLADPFKALQPGGVTAQILSELNMSQAVFREPREVVPLLDNQEISIAGFSLSTRHAPGHTAGSALFVVDSGHLIAGDVLFANGIGRTDMPTGSDSAMRKTLKDRILPLDDELIVLPGHGPQTTIGRERKSNPYLRSEYLDEVI